MPDVRVKLTIEYDGAGFRGWAAQPGERTVEAELQRALDRLYAPGSGGLAVAGRTDAGVHALANVVSVDVDGGPPPGRAAGALNAFLPPDLAVASVERGAGRLPRPLRRPVALVPLPRLAPPRTVGARGDARALASGARSTSPRCSAAAAHARRQARLPGLHADGDAALDLRPNGLERALGRGRREPGRVRDHGRLLPAPHGPLAGRHDAPPPGPRATRSQAAREPKPAARPRRTACT